jgi:hypothetical protein
MRKLAMFGLLAALALAQGPQTPEALYLRGTCGPGYVQSDFLDALRAQLANEFGERRGNEMADHLRGQRARLDIKRTLALLNGQATDQELRDLFGLAHERPQFVRKALEGAVADKEKKLLFGALVRTMVENGVDPSSDFCQLGQSRDSMSHDQFERLCRRDASASLMGECFGLKSRKDQQAMQGYMNDAWASPYLLHPVSASLAGRAKLRGAYDPAKFPKARDEMPGYGNDYKEGMAGGLPFDQGLPPVPFYGRNLEEFFASK